jgi:hypothetical protein
MASTPGDQSVNDLPFQWVVVRSPPEPIVVNLRDDFWGEVNLIEMGLRGEG